MGDIEAADMLLTTKNFYRRRTKTLNEAESNGKSVYVLRKNTASQIHQFLRSLDRNRKRAGSQNTIEQAVKEAEQAANRIDEGERRADLSPRRLHTYAASSTSSPRTEDWPQASSGHEPSRRVVLHRR